MGVDQEFVRSFIHSFFLSFFSFFHPEIDSEADFSICSCMLSLQVSSVLGVLKMDQLLKIIVLFPSSVIVNGYSLFPLRPTEATVIFLFSSKVYPLMY